MTPKGIDQFMKKMVGEIITINPGTESNILFGVLPGNHLVCNGL